MRRLFLLLLFPISVFAQFTPWNTFLDSSRAIDWSTAGFVITEPTVACTTQPSLLAGSGNAAANATSIATSIASCDATHNIVNIPAGTWYFTSIFLRQSNVLIRGAGPNNTTIIPTVGQNCVGGITAGICMESNGNIFNGSASVQPPSGTQQCAWSGGYAQNATSITINACGGTAPPLNEIVILDQLNDSTDNGGVYICDSNTSNCSDDSPDNRNGRNNGTLTRSQQQVTKVTNVVNNGGGSFTLTISPGVYFSNIRSGQTPGIWWGQTITNSGVENLTIDGSTLTATTPTNKGIIGIQQCYQCWVKGIRSLTGGRNHIDLGLTFQDVVRDSYFFGSAAGATSQSYTVEFEEASANLIENNIFQQVTLPIMMGGGTGNVIDYNYYLFSTFTGSSPQGGYWAHNAGNEMNLFEGNNWIFGPWADIVWGGSAQMTAFRNMTPGFQAGKSIVTVPIVARAKQRVMNIVGNVLGTPSYHSVYETYATSATGGVNGGTNEFTEIYTLGWVSIGGCSGTVLLNGCDSAVRSTLMRWGNYDTVNAANRFDSTEASPAAVSFVNANFTSSYFSTLSHTLPNSLHYSSQPSWWLSGVAWPPIGPDITTGNVKECSGGTFDKSQALASVQCTGGSLVTAWASHVNAIPAQVCYLNTMNGPPDGSGSVLAFDSGTCYAPAGGPVGTLSPASLSFGNQPLDLTSSPLTFTLTNTGTGALVVGTIVINGDYAQTNNCPFSLPGLTNGQSCTFNVTFTPTVLGTRNGTVTITSTATNSPNIETLTGTGTAPIFSGTQLLGGTTLIGGTTVTE